ncbi:High affinity Ca2+/Mn2+ P-type ATPase-like protein [Sporothrix stenoceras]|uniref:High affinity Ca2+/Mn2+ P-type ATPase-like protein n=1 Tax=Sporothrix stenoceras TaxID=5173 RepID=A0ABR3Z2M4_9PEZI
MDRLKGSGADEHSLPLYNGKDVPRLSTPQSSGNDDYHSRRSRTPNHIRTTSAQSRSIAEEYAFMTPAETAQRLGTSLTHGLTPVEGIARLRDGANEIPHDPPEPLWLRFLGQFKEPLIILLLISAGASVLVGNTSDAISITVAVTIVVTVGFVQEYRSEKSIEALNHLVPDHAHLIRTVSKDASPGARPSPLSNWPSSSDVNGDPQTPSDPRLQLADLDTASGAVTPTEEVIQATSTKVLAQQLVPGDLVLFTTGDRIPADIRVTKAVDLTIDASNLTGENEPVRLTSDVRSRVNLPFSPGVNPKSSSNSLPLPSPIGNGPGGSLSASNSDNAHNDKNIAYMGTLVKSGHGQGIVFATGGNTHFGTISLSVSGTESPRSPLQLSMDDLGAQLSKFSFIVIGLISFIGWLQGKGLLDIFTISISLAVAAIPEGLPIIVTVTLALGVHRMAGRNAIVRKMPKVETLGSVNVVCTDKTGTLTMNHMTVTKLWYFGRESPVEVDAEEDASEAKPDAAATRILRIGNIANNARLSRRYRENGAGARAVLSSTLNQEDGPLSVSRWVGQPTDVAVMDLVDRYKEHDVRDAIGPRVVETPFSSERKWMGVTIGSNNNDNKNDKEFAYIKGALDRVLEACDTYVSSDGREIVLDGKRKQEAIEEADKLASQGLRVIAFASGPVSNKSAKSRAAAAANAADKNGHHHVAFSEEPYKGLTFAGLVGMSDPPRPGVGRSIRKLMRGGVKVIMITGDAETTALAIGHQLGMSIARPVEHAANQVAVHPVLRGEDVEALSEEDLAQAMQQTTIFARTNPDHKMKIIRALQARGDIVAMTGDGVNDAPALKKADIGIAMGRHGTDVAKEAADMILTDDDFSTILHAIEEGKGIFNNIQNFLTFQLSTSAAGLSLVLLCTCFGYKSPLNAMQILWINIIMDGPPAQSLGVEAVDRDVMKRPPRKRNDPVLTRELIRRVAQSAFIIMVGTMLVYKHEMLDGAVVTRRDTTMTFTCFVLFDMFNALTCRSESKSVLRGEVGLFTNTLFNWAVSLSLAGQLLVIYFPWLQEVFQTEALGLGDLFKLVILCSTVFWADEARKWYRYGRHKRYGISYSQV